MARRIATKSENISPAPRDALPFTFLEFFAGGGMARAGLGAEWRCLFANDFDEKKAAAYVANWGADVMRVGDVKDISACQLPAVAPDLAWASFPCQDLSLAGVGAGLKGGRSGAFWLFWERMKELAAEKRAPRMIVLENVSGTLTSHDGDDFKSIVQAAVDLGYDIGALTIDAQLFVPQSRQRVFFVAVPRDVAPRKLSVVAEEGDIWRSAALKRAYSNLPEALQRRWIWWTMPLPAARSTRFADLIEENPADVAWHTPAETARLLAMMTGKNLAKVATARAAGKRMVGGMYRRMRADGEKTVQRVEVRFDDVSGCLRTPGGGSSRQTILVVDGERVRSRLVSARETARLMGLPDEFRLPKRYNDAYHLTGDGVVVPVVRYLAEHILEPHLNQIAGEVAVSKGGVKKTANKRKPSQALKDVALKPPSRTKQVRTA